MSTILSIIAVAADGAQQVILNPHVIEDDTARMLAETVLSESSEDAVLHVENHFVPTEGDTFTILGAGAMPGDQQRPRAVLSPVATRFIDAQKNVRLYVGTLRPHGDMRMAYSALHIGRPDRIKLIFDPFPEV